MFNIDWHQLEKNAEKSPQDFFEKLIYQIVVKRYQSLGFIKYFYNTPGSEFYLTLNKECDLESIPLKTGEDRKSTRLNSSHIPLYRMPSSA